MRELVLIHGRSQQDRDPVALKREWIEALSMGMEKAGLSLQLEDKNVRFVYYGQCLGDYVDGGPNGTIAPVVVRGSNDVSRLVGDLLLAQLEGYRVTAEEVASLKATKPSPLPEGVVMRGPANWEWVQRILRVVDRHLPFASAAAIWSIFHDVYRYIEDRGFRGKILAQAESGLGTEVKERVIVSHSLGTVVAHDLLSLPTASTLWKVPLWITLGSPLGIDFVKSGLSGQRFPSCVSRWFNAYDERDTVALHSLSESNFPVLPSKIVENNAVRNFTENRHGIAGYLTDTAVATEIYQALDA